MGLQVPSTDTQFNIATANSAAVEHGQYQFLTLEDIVKTFLATYCGDGKICEKVRANDVYFHATRAMQEFSYDVFRSIKSVEIDVDNTLSMILTTDFVNQVKLSYSDAAGIQHVIYPTRISSNPLEPLKDDDGKFLYDANGETLYANNSDTWGDYKSSTPAENQNRYDDEYYKDFLSERYGIDPEHAQINGSYYIDYDAGKIHFSSNLNGQRLILEYISDGLAVTVDSNGTSYSTNALVHKFAEEAMYKHIAYGCLSTLKDTQPGTLMLLKKERFAETRKAKLRLSNIKLEEITQILRGKSKQIKH